MEFPLEIRYPYVYITASFIVHIVGSIHFTAALAWFFYFVVSSQKLSILVAFQHFSVWSCSIHIIYSTFSAATDVVIFHGGRPAVSEILYDIRSYMRACFSFPSAVFDNMVFWWFYDSNKDTIYNKAEMPMYVLHMSNTGLVVYQVFDFIFCEVHYPKSILCSVAVLAFYFVYILVFELLAMLADEFVYPFKDSGAKRLYIYFIGAIFIYVFYMLGRFINNILWDVETALKIFRCEYFQGLINDKNNRRSSSTTGSLVKIFSSQKVHSGSVSRIDIETTKKSRFGRILGNSLTKGKGKN